MADLRATGADVRRIDVEIRELASWRRDRGRPLDSGARSLRDQENEPVMAVGTGE